MNAIVVIGLSEIGLSFIKKLPEDTEIVVIDKDPDVVESVKVLEKPVRVITGDATSRLILKEAPINDADAVVITITKEEVNIEISRLLREHFSPRRVLSIGITPEGIEKLMSMDIEVESIFEATAIGLRNRLQQKAKAVHGIGLGKNEILEVEVHPHSRLANKPIGMLAPIRWRIGLIYREGRIILPRKDTILLPKDRVVILGEPTVLKTVSEMLTFSFQRFPLEYGSTLVGYLLPGNKRYIDELDYLISNLPVHRAIIVTQRKEENLRDFFSEENREKISLKASHIPSLGALESQFEEIGNEQALVVIPRDLLRTGPFPFDFSKASFLKRLLRSASCPVLIQGGTFPYKRILAPCTGGLNIESEVEKAIELSNLIKSEITAMVFVPSGYISTEKDTEEIERIKKTLSELIAIHRRSINIRESSGNPVKVIQTIQQDYDLIVLGSSEWEFRMWYASVFSPDLLWLIIKKTMDSIMLIPTVAEAL